MNVEQPHATAAHGLGIADGQDAATSALLHTVIDTRFEQFDAATVDLAKWRLLDIVGCMIGGVRVSGSDMLRELVVRRGGLPAASIAVTGERVPMAAAAFVNSIMARGNDFGVLIPNIGTRPVWSHISESTVPAALAVGESRGSSGRDVLAALIVGDDLTTRLSAAASYTPGSGWDSPGIVNKFGVAAIAGRLLGLDAAELNAAFGIVLNQLAGSFQAIDDGAHTFKLAQGLAARDGIEAAELAATGWTGSRDPLLGKNGYFDLYCGRVNRQLLLDDLGERFHGDATFKPYPSCRFTHSTIDCVREIVGRATVAPADIEEIVIDVAPMHIDSPLDQLFRPDRYAHAHAIFSLRYVAASTLLRGAPTLEHFTDGAIADATIASLAARTSVTGGQQMRTPEAARVTLRLRDGRELSAQTDTALGNPLMSPLSTADIETKFRNQCTFADVFTPARVSAIVDTVMRFETLADVSDLARLLTSDR